MAIGVILFSRETFSVDVVTLFQLPGLVFSGILTLFVGRLLIPDRATADRTDDYELRNSLIEITVLPHSPLIGQPSFVSDLSLLSFRVLRLFRGHESFDNSVPIAVGDRIRHSSRTINTS